jgi:phosphoenolpyruvate-protein kinase (PTS system EI component)
MRRQQTVTAQADKMASMHNAPLAVRADGLQDVGQRVLQNLTGMGPRKIDVPARCGS